MSSSETVTAHPDLPEHPGHLIRRAHQIAVSVFYETLGRAVTPIQYAVLHTLQQHPGIDQVTLAHSVALDTSTAADIAARLEGKGWITRKVLARSQRELRLTDEGEQLLARMAPGMHELQAALLGNLSTDEQAAFMQLLSKFVTVNNERSRAPMRS